MLRSSFNPAAAFDNSDNQDSLSYSTFAGSDGNNNNSGALTSLLLESSPSLNQQQMPGKGINASKYTDRLSHITDSQVLSPFLNSIRPMTPASSHFGTPQMSFSEDGLASTPMTSMAGLLLERSSSPYPGGTNPRPAGSAPNVQRPQQRRSSTPGFLFSNSSAAQDANANKMAVPRPRSNSHGTYATGSNMMASPMNSAAYGMSTPEFFSNELMMMNDSDSSANALNMFGHPALQDRSTSFMDLINGISSFEPIPSHPQQAANFGISSVPGASFNMGMESNVNSLNVAMNNSSPAMSTVPIQSHVGNPVWSCVCGHTFEDWMVFQAHLQTHRAEARPHVCEHCKRGFARRQDLKRHIPTHFKPFKPFECSTCHTTFTRNDALQRHLKAARCEIKIKKMKLKLEKERAAGQTSSKSSAKDSEASSPEEKPVDTGYSESGTHQIPSPPISSQPSENNGQQQQQSSLDLVTSTVAGLPAFTSSTTAETMGFPLVGLSQADIANSQLYSLPSITQQ